MCCILYVICYQLSVVCYLSYVICYMLYASGLGGYPPLTPTPPPAGGVPLSHPPIHPAAEGNVTGASVEFQTSFCNSPQCDVNMHRAASLELDAHAMVEDFIEPLSGFENLFQRRHQNMIDMQCHGDVHRLRFFFDRGVPRPPSKTINFNEIQRQTQQNQDKYRYAQPAKKTNHYYKLYYCCYK